MLTVGFLMGEAPGSSAELSPGVCVEVPGDESWGCTQYPKRPLKSLAVGATGDRGRAGHGGSYCVADTGDPCPSCS